MNTHSKLDTVPHPHPAFLPPCSGRFPIEDDANGAPCEGKEGHEGECVAHIRVTWDKTKVGPR